MDKEKNLVINKQVLFTIPNILTYIRIICVPIYMTLLILGAKPEYPTWWVYLSLGIMAFAASTDLIDGKIARKYEGQGTYLGQLIDPVADKLMHVGALVALTVAGYIHWGFVIALLSKEVVLMCCSFFVMNKINVQANMMGKVASATISGAVILCFFHPFMVPQAFGIDWMVLTIGIIMSWVSAFGYLTYMLKELKKVKNNETK